MRTVLTAVGLNITYPDKVTFAFNPNPIIVENTDAEEFSMTFTFGDKFTDQRISHNSRLSIDISSYLQSLFQKGEYFKKVNVEATDNNGLVEVLEFDVFWGAINIGERFNGSHTLTWFDSFPMTVPIYVPTGGKLSVNIDNQGYTDISSTEGLHTIDMTAYAGHKSIRFKMLGSAEVGVFDYTFDWTFKAVNENTSIIQINASDCQEGIYLRWVDRHAFQRFYLFNKGAVTDQSKSRTSITEDYSDDMPRYGVARDDKTLVRTVHIGAPLVDKDTYSLLKMMESSPIVDMYVDGHFVPVRIKPTTSKDSNEDLQDYEIEIILPEIISQML